MESASGQFRQKCIMVAETGKVTSIGLLKLCASPATRMGHGVNGVSGLVGKQLRFPDSETPA